MKISKITPLLLLLNTVLYADTPQEASKATPTETPKAAPASSAKSTTDGKETTNESKPAVTAPAPAAATPTPTTTPAAPTTPSAAASAPSVNEPINCSYHIASGQKIIDTKIISTWVENATVQAFTFSPATIDSQLTELKQCFTDQGWKGFNTALQKSGNLTSIKKHMLNVSCHIEQSVTVNSLKDGQWKATLPITVTYQNEKEKAVQQLNVSIVLGRKGTSQLGIIQLIAATRPADKATPTNTTQPQKTEPTKQNTTPAA